jgi:UPF0716 family protein affecting phage T7 exclusion
MEVRAQKSILEAILAGSSGGPKESWGLALLTAWWDLHCMGGFVFAVAQQQPTAGSLAGSHMFWIGVLFALIFSYILPGWLTGILFFVALIASGVLLSLGHHANSSAVPYIIVGLITLVVGLYFGRIRGLRHLGEAELRTRWRNVRGVSRWL